MESEIEEIIKNKNRIKIVGEVSSSKIKITDSDFETKYGHILKNISLSNLEVDLVNQKTRPTKLDQGAEDYLVAYKDNIIFIPDTSLVSDTTIKYDDLIRYFVDVYIIKYGK